MASRAIKRAAAKSESGSLLAKAAHKSPAFLSTASWKGADADKELSAVTENGKECNEGLESRKENKRSVRAVDGGREAHRETRRTEPDDSAMVMNEK